MTTSANPASKPTGADTPADALGVTKRMTISDDDGNQSDDAKCPSCGRSDFASAQGMKRHHYHAHGESLAGKRVECHECSDFKRVRPAKARNYDKHFCSEECRSAWLRGEMSGKSNPSWNGGSVLLTCIACDSEYEVIQSRSATSSFCSKECQGKWMSDIADSEQLPRWDGGEDVSECELCGDRFKHRAKRSARFCSKECHGKWLSENKNGADHPNWRGGHENYYGGSWSKQRKRTRQRDCHECQICGMSGECHKSKTGQKLHVHHIQPFRNFNDHNKANELSNLITVCRSCHYNWEGIPLRPEVVG